MTNINNSPINKDNDKDAGLALILILIITAIVMQHTFFLLPIAILLVIEMTAPICFRPFTIVWFALSNVLGALSSKIILAVLFIILIIPVGYIRRISNSDPLKLTQWKKNSDSSFIKRDHKYKAADMEQPF